MKYDASRPDWPDRDRFVLSSGHASMLLYSYLYLCGFGLTLDDIKEFRQWGSATPGHPEMGHTAGVEITTGPLGQGIANGVGMALAEANLRARFGDDLFDHHVFAFCSDGDFEEGISHEAASLAGHLGLGRLVYVYDDNHISIDGPTELSYSDDVPKRFEAYGWHVVQLGEAANDLDALERGLREGMAETERPTLLVLRSHIGWPSPKYTDSAHAHGNPLGADEVAVVKEILDLPAEDFFVPDDVLAYYRDAGTRGARREAWEKRYLDVQTSDPGRAAAVDACLPGRGFPAGSEGAAVGVGRTSRRVPRAPRCSTRSRGGAGPRRRRRRPHRQHRHRAQGCAGRRHPRLRWPPDPLGHPRARHGFDHERHGGVGAVARGRHLLRVQRLHAARGTARGAVAVPHRVRVVARLRRRGRGRADAPADRAAHGDPRDPRAVRGAAGRRQRGHRGVAAALRGRRPDGRHPHPPGHPRARELGERAPEGCPRRVRARRRAGRRLDLVLIGTGSEVQWCVGARDLLAATG